MGNPAARTGGGGGGSGKESERAGEFRALLGTRVLNERTKEFCLERKRHIYIYRTNNGILFGKKETNIYTNRTAHVLVKFYRF